MENNVFARVEESVELLIQKIDQLQSEKQLLMEEVENLRNHQQKESMVFESVKKEKEALLRQMEQSPVDKTKEALIRQHIGAILKKLEELEMEL